jgi:anthranilate/para-aminobenzoate synthase component II
MENPFEATRYHSLVVERASLPADLVVTATTRDDGTEVIMGMRHQRSDTAGFRMLEGVQFHPESILTHDGRRLLANFLERL